MVLTLRPVEPDDRDRLLAWRNAERVRMVSIDDRLIDADTHASWFEQLLCESRPSTMIVEDAIRPIAVVRLGDFDPVHRSCSWACHLGETQVAPGVGACLPVIGLGLGFESWGASVMYAEVLGTNRNMLGIHRRLGIPVDKVLEDEVVRADFTRVDLVQFSVPRAIWPQIRQAAERLLPSGTRADLVSLLATLPRASDHG